MGKTVPVLRYLLLLLGLVTIVGSCKDERFPTQESSRAVPAAQAVAQGTDTLDVSLFEPVDPGAPLQTSSPAAASTSSAIVLPDESEILITVIFTETASQNTLLLTSPISVQLASGNPITGSFRFGPFPAGSLVTLDLLSGIRGGASSLQRIDGTPPCSIVSFEDFFDNDFNDLVVIVNTIPVGSEFQFTGPGAAARIEPSQIGAETRGDGTTVTAQPANFIVEFSAVTGCSEQPVDATIDIHSARSEFNIGPRIERFSVSGRGQLEFPIPAGTPVTRRTQNRLLCMFAVYRAPSGFGSSFFTFLRDCAEIVEAVEETVVIRTVDGSLEARPEGTGGNTTVSLEVGVFDDEGNPLPNREVSLTLAAIENTGAHDHDGARPAGELEPSSPYNSGPSGVLNVTYKAPRVSGLVTILGQSEGATEAQETITVKVPGLEAIPLSGRHYGFVSSNLHSSGDFFMAPGAITAMNQIWKRYVDEGFPIKSTKKFFITAATLVWGGLYDIAGNWQPPHASHKQGGDLDFDDPEAEAEPQFMGKVCQKFEFGGQRVVCELHNGDHFHAYLGPNR